MSTMQTMVKMTMDRWNASIKNFDDLLTSFSDEQLLREIAPGKNRGIYLLGHLVAVHDSMMPLLGFGDKFYPELSKNFLESPDNAAAEMPSVKELRDSWYKINRLLSQHFESLQPEDWFQRHTAVSPEDFAKEPHRNKLNIIITRTNHLAYHTGQFVWLK